MLRHEVAAANNLPPCWPARLQGATREEMEADAKALADLLPAANTAQAPQGFCVGPGAGCRRASHRHAHPRRSRHRRTPQPQRHRLEICELMAQTPTWVHGLLLGADGYECDFYRKD